MIWLRIRSNSMEKIRGFWYAFLTGKDISENDFNELEEPLLENERNLAIKIVSEVVNSVKNFKE